MQKMTVAGLLAAAIVGAAGCSSETINSAKSDIQRNTETARGN